MVLKVSCETHGDLSSAGFVAAANVGQPCDSVFIDRSYLYSMHNVSINWQCGHKPLNSRSVSIQIHSLSTTFLANYILIASNQHPI